MKKFVYLLSVLTACALLSSCGVLCQAGTGTCAMTKEEAQRLLHPKSYGQYWTKPAMTTESWRQDWVECGGRANGSYGSSLPQGTADVVVRADEKSKKIRLDSCMQSKGYQYNYTGLTLAK